MIAAAISPPAVEPRLAREVRRRDRADPEEHGDPAPGEEHRAGIVGEPLLHAAEVDDATATPRGCTSETAG